MERDIVAQPVQDFDGHKFYAADIRNSTLNPDINGTLQSKSGGGWNANSNQIVCYSIGGVNSEAWLSANPKAGIYQLEISRTLDAIQCGNPACNQGGVAIVHERKE